MTADAYHAHPAIGSTTLKLCLTSMAKFKAMRDGLIPKSEAEHFNLGTAAHSAVLEQHFSYILGPDAAKNTKEWKEFAKKHDGLICLQPHHYELIKGMYDAYYAHPLVSKITNKGDSELSFFRQIGGIEYKARTDYLVNDYIVDYKTCASLDYEDIQRAIFNYGYDVSAAHYIRVVEGSRNIAEYYWIFQEKEPPYEIAVFRMDEDCRTRATRVVDRLYQKIVKATETREWTPRFEPKLYDIDLAHYNVSKRMVEL